jgi:hypothetical protein
MNVTAPSDGRALAGQKPRKETKGDEMKTETALLNIAPHNPLENTMQGFTREGIRQNFVRLLQIETIYRIIKIGIGRNVVRSDHDDLALLRASWRNRWKEILRFAAK